MPAKSADHQVPAQQAKSTASHLAQTAHHTAGQIAQSPSAAPFTHRSFGAFQRTTFEIAPPFLDGMFHAVMRLMRTLGPLAVVVGVLSLGACSSGVGWVESGGSGGEGGSGAKSGSGASESGSGAAATGQGGGNPSAGVGNGPTHNPSSGAGANGGDSPTGSGAGSTGSGAGSTGSGAGSTGSGAGSTGSGAGPTGSVGSGTPSESCAGTVPQVEGCYWEPVGPDASLSDIDSSYSSGNWLSAALEATNRRYPSANCLFDMYSNDVGNFADTWDFGPLCESMMTMMHEETHGYDYEHALGNSHFSYYIRCDLALKTPWLDGFPRSEILPYVVGNATNLYDGTYLTGTQGTYGWVEVLDEWNAYINGMAAIGVVGDHVPAFGISGTDGALAFAYYVELYLKVARTEYPSTYSAIKNDAAFQGLLKLQWNRMHFFLKIADKYPKLSIEADAIRDLLYAPENQSELEMVIGTLAADACN